MKTGTIVALSAVIQADPPRSPADRAELKRALGLADEDIPQAGDRLVTFAEAGRLIGRGKRSIHHLAHRGAIQKVRFPGSARCAGVRLSDIEKLLAGEVAL